MFTSVLRRPRYRTIVRVTGEPAVETIKKRYRIWRAVQVYIGVIRQAPARTLSRLFVLALIDVALTVVPSSIHVANPLGALVLSLIWSLAAWVALILYLTTFTSELFQSLNQTVSSPRERLFRLAVVAIVLSICWLALVTVIRSFAVDSGRTRLVSLLYYYVILVWSTISAILVVQGSRPLGSIWKSIGFVFDNIGKVVVFLILAVVFQVILTYGVTATINDALGEGLYATQFLSFFGLFAPALFLPVVCVMYVKVEYFPDRLYPPRYLK